jgi:hypothetical protein
MYRNWHGDAVLLQHVVASGNPDLLPPVSFEFTYDRRSDGAWVAFVRPKKGKIAS